MREAAEVELRAPGGARAGGGWLLTRPIGTPAWSGLGRCRSIGTSPDGIIDGSVERCWPLEHLNYLSATSFTTSTQGVA